MGRKVFVVGVGMTKFEKPGRREDFDYPDMVKESVTKALNDANLKYDQIQQAVAAYVYGDSTCGQRALYEIGMTGIPIYNVNNNCSTGSSALFLAKQLVEGGVADCVLAVGFEKMERGSLMSKFNDRTNPLDKHVTLMADLADLNASPVAAQMFGNAFLEHSKKYGTTVDHIAKIAQKNHKHSVNNPNSQFRDEYSLDQIKKSPQVFGPLTKLQCCPTSDGSAAAIVVSEEFVKKFNLQNKAVEVVAMEMVTDLASTFTDKSLMKIVGYDMTKLAAARAFSKSGHSPNDVQVVELHDCFSANELITYEALGLCGPGQAGALIDRGDNTYGGKYVVNPSGGLISKGHPLGATGLAQCAELCWQLRGEAGKRQVANCKLALQQNIGLGGAVIVSLYKLGFPRNEGPKGGAVPSSNSAGVEGPSDFIVTPFMSFFEEAMNTDEDNLVEKFRGIYGFKVKNKKGKEAYWVINAKVGKGKITFNGKDKPDVTFIVNDEDIVDLITGKLLPQKAFFQGKIKIQGNLGMAMKLQDLLKQAEKKIEMIRSKL